MFKGHSSNTWHIFWLILDPLHPRVTLDDIVTCLPCAIWHFSLKIYSFLWCNCVENDAWHFVWPPSPEWHLFANLPPIVSRIIWPNRTKPNRKKPGPHGLIWMALQKTVTFVGFSIYTYLFIFVSIKTWIWIFIIRLILILQTFYQKLNKYA